MTGVVTTLQSLVGVVAAQCQSATGLSCNTNLPQTPADGTTISSVLTFVFATIAVLSVLMIVIAGLRFVTSSGNPQETAKARNTIIYAVLGLVIALAAQSLVDLVVNKL